MGRWWLALRSSRLTASAFSNACGFWRGGRNELWEEKLGLAEPFAGNEATEWGSGKEDEAVAAYKNLTGADVSHMLFRVLSPDEAELWLGASPDGLIAAPRTTPPLASRPECWRSSARGTRATRLGPNRTLARHGVTSRRCRG